MFPVGFRLAVGNQRHDDGAAHHKGQAGIPLAGYGIGKHSPALDANKPWFAQRFVLPTRQDIDWPLISGGAMFGVGWGLGGFCPGPALAAWTTNSDLVWFVPAMLAGMWVANRVKA